MKKKSLVALVAALTMVMGVTTVHAEETITGPDTQTYTAPVTVNGSVTDSSGTAPEGMLSITVPTAAAFGVDANGTLTGTEMTVSNNSAVAVEVSVANFTETIVGGGIEVVSTLDSVNDARNVVKLALTGNTGSANLVTDGTMVETLLSVVDAASQDIITLGGEAGQAVDAVVDAEGAAEEFNIVFKIAKQ